MWNFLRRKPKHIHSWKVVSAAHYESIVGPRTILGYVCQTCYRVDDNNVKGVFHVSDFQ